MNKLVSWLVGILAMVLLYTVTELLLSHTRLHKFIKSALSAVTILVVIIPLPSLIKSGFTDIGGIFDGQFELDEEYLEAINAQKIKRMEEGVELALKQDGIKGVKVKIKAEFGKEITVQNVSINLSELVIDDKITHINKYEVITQAVTQYLNIVKEVITFDG